MDELNELLAGTGVGVVGAMAALPPAESSAACDSLLVESGWWFIEEDGLFDSVVSQQATRSSASRSTESRRRQKEELEYLRARVAALEAELVELKKPLLSASPEPDQASDTDSVTTSTDSLATGADAFWQRLALSERKARQRSVQENMKLRAMLESQLRLAKSLDKLLKKRRVDEAEMEFRWTEDDSTKRHRFGDTDDDTEIFELLAQNFDSRYAQIDSVFQECGLAQNHKTFEDARAIRPKAGAWYLEFVDSTVVPFEYTLTRDANWLSFQSACIPLENGVYEVVDVTDDTIKGMISIRMHHGEVSMVGRARFVVRKYVEFDRFVLVWALWSTAEGGVLKSQRMRLIEEGWGLVAPIGDGSSSLVQACGRMRPNMAIRAGTKLEEYMALVTDVVLGTYHDSIRGMKDHFARTLLDMASGRLLQ